jgi:2-amino-4-hydroxy-6-hydroxymethyldihydropteridine diphosphokinase
VLIGLGSNQGRPLAQLEAAVRALRADPDVTVTAVSPWYRSRPVGGPTDQPDFLNGVLAARTRLAPEELLERLQEIERSLGRARAREVRHGPRPLDLDLLFYDDLELALPHLVVPHPRLEERAFVLVPLADVAPERRLSSGLTVRERLAELSSEGVVREPTR